MFTWNFCMTTFVKLYPDVYPGEYQSFTKKNKKMFLRNILSNWCILWFSIKLHRFSYYVHIYLISRLRSHYFPILPELFSACEFSIKNLFYRKFSTKWQFIKLFYFFMNIRIRYENKNLRKLSIFSLKEKK